MFKLVAMHSMEGGYPHALLPIQIGSNICGVSRCAGINAWPGSMWLLEVYRCQQMQSEAHLLASVSMQDILIYRATLQKTRPWKSISEIFFVPIKTKWQVLSFSFTRQLLFVPMLLDCSIQILRQRNETKNFK